MLGLFLEAQGHPLPQNSKSKSASALSRFFNVYDWSTRGVIRTTRNRVIQEILSERPLGRKPFLQVIIDLTTLEKVGKFKAFENLIRVYNGRRGLHACCGVFSCWSVAYSLEFSCLEGKRYYFPSEFGIKNGQIFAEKINLALRGYVFGRYRLWYCAIFTRCQKEKIPYNCWHCLYPQVN